MELIDKIRIFAAKLSTRVINPEKNINAIMIKRLLNPHTLLKITLILTALLLPASSWGNVGFQTVKSVDIISENGSSNTYSWKANWTNSKWSISCGTRFTLNTTGFSVELYQGGGNLGTINMTDFARPTPSTCDIKGINISGENLNNCTITVKAGSNYQFTRTGTTGSFTPSNGASSYQWSDASNKLSISIVSGSSTVNVKVESITIELTNIDDNNTEFRWPESVNGFVFNHDFNSLTVDAGLLQTFSYPLELSDFSGVTAASTSRNVTYRSSEQQIATIDNGEITLRKIGETVITATVNDNNDYHYTNGHKEYSFTLKSIFQGPTLSLEEGIQNFGSPIYMTFPGDYNAVSIKYKWQDESEQTYDPQNPPTVKAGELTAWGEITNNGTIIKSEVVTATYVASYDITIAGTAVTSNNAGNILSGGVNNEKVSYDQGTNTLTMNNAVLTDDIICNTTSLFIDIQGHNTITTNGKPAITTTLETGSPKITIKSTSETKGSLVLKNTSIDTPCGGVFRGSSTIITVYTDNPIATLLPTDPNNLTSDTTHIAVFGELYQLTIGEVAVNYLNASDILGDGKASYNPTERTLSLNGVSTPMISYSNPEQLNIEISGSNTVGMIVGYGGDNNLLTIKKKKGDSSPASLDVNLNGDQANSDKAPIFHFSNCTWEEGLFLEAYSDTKPIYGAYYENDRFRHISGRSIDRVTFSENEPEATPSIWIGRLEPNEEGKFTLNGEAVAGIQFDASSKTLTLQEVNLSDAGNIVSSLPSLTIKLVGRTSFLDSHKIISTNPEATLTFTTEESDPGSLSSSLGNGGIPWEGFKGNPTFKNKLVFMQFAGTEYIKVLHSPEVSYNEENLEINGLVDNIYQNKQLNYYYSITYVDGKGNVTKELHEINNPETTQSSVSVPMSPRPCEVRASVEYTDIFGNKTESEESIGKYLGFKKNPVRSVSDGINTVDVTPEIIPSITEDDAIQYGFHSESDNVNITEENGKVTMLGFGVANVSLWYEGGKTTILNPYTTSSSLQCMVEAVPAAPTIDKAAGTYLDTESINISSTAASGCSIMYCWNDKTASLYSKAIPVQEGTLKAWVEYEQSTGTETPSILLFSDTVSVTYTIKKDINNTYILEYSEATVYSGTTITPSFKIAKEESNETVIDASNYDVSYTKIINDEPTAVQSIKDVGDYQIIITAKGNTYGGRKEIPFFVEQADFANVTIDAIADQVYTGENLAPTITAKLGDVTLTNEEYNVSYTLGDVATTEVKNAGTYTVTLTSTGKNLTTTTTKTATFKINKATISPKVTLAGWTYGATANTPSVSGNTGNGEVTYAYKLQNEAESAFAAAVPTNAGAYTVKASIAATANYEAASDSAHFTITKADITPTITLEGWTYGSTPNKPEVKGNTGNGAETFTYKTEGSEAFTSEVPTAVGTHIVKVTIAETTNYNGGEATATFTIINRTFNPANDITFAEGQTYASFYSSSEDLELPEEGIAVFMITGLNGNTLTTQAVSYIPKGVPVLVMKASGTTQAIDPNEVSSNMLQYATSDVNADGTTYILYNGEYVRATGTIPAGKCYLKLNKPSGARKLTIGNETTGIDRLDNTVWATENWFDLNGRRIERPTKKGLYIMNGKKVVVK